MNGPGTPRRLFTRQDSGSIPAYNLDEGFAVFPDGEPFSILLPGDTEDAARRSPSITVVENWIVEFPGR